MLHKTDKNGFIINETSLKKFPTKYNYFQLLPLQKSFIRFIQRVKILMIF